VRREKYPYHVILYEVPTYHHLIMDIYNDLEGPQKVMRCTTPQTANKRRTINRDEISVQKIYDYSSRLKKSGAHHPNSTRVPFGSSNRNVHNSADFHRNRSAAKLGITPKDTDTSCTTMTPFSARSSRARPKEKLQFSAERTVSQMNRSERGMERSRSSGWQEGGAGGGVLSPMELRAFDNVIERSCSLGGKKGGGDDASFPWQMCSSDNMRMSSGNISLTSRQSTIPQSCTKASPRIHEKVQISLHRSNSVCRMNGSDRVTKSTRSLGGQETVGASFARQLRAYNSATKSAGDTPMSPRLRRLRSFITDQRRKRARAEARKSDTHLREYESPPFPPLPCMLDDTVHTNLQNKSTERLTEVIEGQHKRRERTHSQKVLVGTDICVPKPHDSDTHIGIISDNEDTTSMTSSETK